MKELPRNHSIQDPKYPSLFVSSESNSDELIMLRQYASDLLQHIHYLQQPQINNTSIIQGIDSELSFIDEVSNDTDIDLKHEYKQIDKSLIPENPYLPSNDKQYIDDVEEESEDYYISSNSISYTISQNNIESKSNEYKYKDLLSYEQIAEIQMQDKGHTTEETTKELFLSNNELKASLSLSRSREEYLQKALKEKTDASNREFQQLYQQFKHMGEQLKISKMEHEEYITSSRKRVIELEECNCDLLHANDQLSMEVGNLHQQITYLRHQYSDSVAIELKYFSLIDVMKTLKENNTMLVEERNTWRDRFKDLHDQLASKQQNIDSKAEELERIIMNVNNVVSYGNNELLKRLKLAAFK